MTVTDVLLATRECGPAMTVCRRNETERQPLEEAVRQRDAARA